MDSNRRSKFDSPVRRWPLALRSGRSLSLTSGARILLCLGLTYTTQGVSSPTGAANVGGGVTKFSNRPNTDVAVEVEWDSYLSTTHSLTLAYKMARNNEIKRTTYQAGAVGWRFYPTTLGYPLREWKDGVDVSYDAFFKPYLEGGISLGRYFIQTFGAADRLELSTEFIGIDGGVGSHFQIVQRLALDLNARVEAMRGYGPTPFQGRSVTMRVGFVYTN